MTWEEPSPTSRSSAVLVRNKWFTVEPTVGELRIRLGERALKQSRKGRQPPLTPTPEYALPGENVLTEDDELVRAV